MVAVQTFTVKDLHLRKTLHVWLFVNRRGNIRPQHSGSRNNSTCSNRWEFVNNSKNSQLPQTFPFS